MCCGSNLLSRGFSASLLSLRSRSNRFFHPAAQLHSYVLGRRNHRTISSLPNVYSPVRPQHGIRRGSRRCGSENAELQVPKCKNAFHRVASKEERLSTAGGKALVDQIQHRVIETTEACTSSLIRSKKRAKQPQLTVAVDIDEVLGSFLTALNTFVAERYFLEHSVSEYHVYDFTEVWGCSRVEADLRVHAFFKSEHFDKGILPIPGAYQSLLQIASYCHLYVVTSRQNIIKEATLAWIERHYSGIFKEVHFGNHFALEGEARSKSEICRCVGAQVLVDDNPGYALDCAINGIEVLLFDYNNSYPWSKTSEGPNHPLITRVHNWEEVEKFLEARLKNALR